MSAEYTYDYAVIKVMPRVDRGEVINVGVILNCPDLNFLDVRVDIDEARLRMLDPGIDIDDVRSHLAAFPAVCQGGEHAGVIGELPQRNRYYWLVSVRSTIIQVSIVLSSQQPEQGAQSRVRGPGACLHRAPPPCATAARSVRCQGVSSVPSLTPTLTYVHARIYS